MVNGVMESLPECRQSGRREAAAGEKQGEQERSRVYIGLSGKESDRREAGVYAGEVDRCFQSLVRWHPLPSEHV